TFARSSRYCWRGAAPATAPGLGDGRAAAGGCGDEGAIGVAVAMTALPDGREPLDAERASPARRHRLGRLGAGVDDAADERVELRRHLGVAAERQRHAGIERARDRLVVARKGVEDRLPERALQLRRRNRI